MRGLTAALARMLLFERLTTIHAHPDLDIFMTDRVTLFAIPISLLATDICTILLLAVEVDQVVARQIFAWSKSAHCYGTLRYDT